MESQYNLDTINEMKFRGFILYIPFLWVEGMALFPLILVRRRKSNPTLINHERIHLRQQLEMLILPFYIWYVLEYLILLLYFRNHYKAYRYISFEREAFINERKTDYLRKRPFWAFLRYIF
ncbi:hypothetical protein GCM10027291_28990 [Telluribacter humicola]